MTIYTVHEPRKLTGDPAADAERYVFVRDGFHVWAFLLGPLWMLWHRMWLVLLGYIVLTIGVQIGLGAAGASGLAKFAVGVLLAFLVAFEAATLRRWSLRKRRQVGIVVGRDMEEAERRYFDSWIGRDALPAYPPAPAAMPPARASGPTDVIGLFPEPDARPRT
jgi:hypothetical protein